MSEHRLHKCKINSYLSKLKKERNIQNNAAEDQGI